MNMWRRISVFLVCCALVVANGFGAWTPGKPLPNLGGFDASGDMPKLEEKVALVDFWASWCAPCKASFPAMAELHEKYKDRGFEIVAISVDAKESAMQRFVDRTDPPFSIVFDAKQKLARAAAIEVMPTSFLVDRKGKIRFAHQGWKGRKSKEELEAQIIELLEE